MPLPLGVVASASVAGDGEPAGPPPAVGWTHWFSIYGPLFLAEGYVPNADLPLIPDEAGTADWDYGVGSPGYDGRFIAGHMDFSDNAGTPPYQDTTSTVAGTSPNIAVPVTVAVFGKIGGVAGSTGPFQGMDFWLQGLGLSFNAFVHPDNVNLEIIDTTAVLIDSGVPTDDPGPHLWVAYVEAAQATLEVDGVTIGTEAFDNTGNTLDDLVITPNASPETSWFDLIGVYDGDARTDPAWADFETWATG